MKKAFTYSRVNIKIAEPNKMKKLNAVLHQTHQTYFTDLLTVEVELQQKDEKP